MQENNQPEQFKLNGDASASNSLHSQPRPQQANADNRTEGRVEQEPTGKGSRPKKKKKISKDVNRRRLTKKKVEVVPLEQQEAASVSRHQDSEACCQRALPAAKPLWELADTQTSESFHSQIDSSYFCSINPEHCEKLTKLVHNKPVQITELLNERTQSQRINQERTLRYLQFLKDSGRQHEREIVVLFEENGRYFQLFYEAGSSGELQLQAYLQLKDHEYTFLKVRQTCLTQLNSRIRRYGEERQQLGHPVPELDELSRQLLFFNGLLQLENRKLQKRTGLLLDLIRNFKQPQRVPASELAQLKDDGMRMLLWKSLTNSVLPKRIDILNYFRSRAATEQNKSFQPIYAQRDLIEYVRKKIVKKNKKTKYPLPTGCLGCLSDRYEQCNPFKNCYECGSRFHKNCLAATQSICTVCDGRRLRRTQSDECFACPNRNLMYKRVGDDKNIHIWCMLAFNLFEVRNQEVIYRSDDLDEEMDAAKCNICSKDQGRLIKCSCSSTSGQSCGKSVHPLCAYLHGQHLQAKGANLEFNCQKWGSDEVRLEQEFLRKYTLNYNKTAYKCFSLDDFLKSKQSRFATLSEEAPIDEDQQEPEGPAPPNDPQAEEPFLSQ